MCDDRRCTHAAGPPSAGRAEGAPCRRMCQNRIQIRWRFLGQRDRRRLGWVAVRFWPLPVERPNPAPARSGIGGIGSNGWCCRMRLIFTIMSMWLCFAADTLFKMSQWHLRFMFWNKVLVLIYYCFQQSMISLYLLLFPSRSGHLEYELDFFYELDSK